MTAVRCCSTCYRRTLANVKECTMFWGRHSNVAEIRMGRMFSWDQINLVVADLLDYPSIACLKRVFATVAEVQRGLQRSLAQYFLDRVDCLVHEAGSHRGPPYQSNCHSPLSLTKGSVLCRKIENLRVMLLRFMVYTEQAAIHARLTAGSGSPDDRYGKLVVLSRQSKRRSRTWLGHYQRRSGASNEDTLAKVLEYFREEPEAKVATASSGSGGEGKRRDIHHRWVCVGLLMVLHVESS